MSQEKKKSSLFEEEEHDRKAKVEERDRRAAPAPAPAPEVKEEEEEEEEENFQGAQRIPDLEEIDKLARSPEMRDEAPLPPPLPPPPAAAAARTGKMHIPSTS